MKRQSRTVQNSTRVHTTVADLTSAFFEAALAELGDEKLAERITSRWITHAVRSGRVCTAAA